MILIETERLILRNFTDHDWEDLHEMIVQYEASELATYDQQWPTSIKEIKGITKWFASGDNFLAVCLKDTGQFIGFVDVNPEMVDEYNIGYVFNANYHGRGYVTEACNAVFHRAFGQLHASRLVTGTAAVNQSSCRLLEKLGFRKIGEQITSYKTAEDGKPMSLSAIPMQFQKTNRRKACMNG